MRSKESGVWRVLDPLKEGAVVDGPGAAVEAPAVVRADLVHLPDDAKIPVEAAWWVLLLRLLMRLLLMRWRE